MNSKNSVAIVICTKNRIDDLSKCMYSILSQTYKPSEIIIVDASDSDIVKNYIEKFDNNGIYIKYVKQYGGRLARARNIGIDNANSDIIIFLDDDVVIDKKYIEELNRVYENDSDHLIGGVGGTITNFNINRYVNYFSKLFMLYHHSHSGRVLRSGFFTSPTSPFIKGITDVNILGGSNMSYRKDVFNNLKFDENFDYIDDIDFSYRVSMKYRLFKTEFAQLEHNVSRIGRNYYKLRVMYTYSHFYFYNKFFEKSFENNVYFVWSHLGLLIGYFVFLLLRPSRKTFDELIGYLRGNIMIIAEILKNPKSSIAVK